MLSIAKKHVLVRIDKKAQAEKREHIGSIIVPPAYIYMKFNLQYGAIEQIGSVAKAYFPDMEVGDVALFHHTIEDGDDRLLEVLPDGDELRYVNGDNNMSSRNFQIFGIFKPDGTLVPSPIFLFLDKIIRPAKPHLRSKVIITTDQEMWKEPERIRAWIKDIEEQEQWLAESWAHTKDRQFVSDEELRGFEEAEKAIIDMRKQRAMLTRRLSNLSMYTSEILHIHPKTTELMRGLKTGDRIMTDKRVMYPLDYRNEQCLLIAYDQVWAVAG